jgi:hypothetical protein
MYDDRVASGRVTFLTNFLKMGQFVQKLAEEAHTF